MSKNIVIFTANFFPEDTAIGLYTYQFANYLKHEGYCISVITGFPYYPKWEIFEEYKNKKSFISENIENINIIRYKQFVPKKVSFFGRVKLMLSLLYGTLINCRKIKQCDAIICIVPFTINIIPAFFLKRRTKAKLWVHIQDFEFDLAFESGVLSKENVFIKYLRYCITSFEIFLLKKADIISSISFNMLDKVKTKVANSNTFYFPNWISSKQIEFSDISKKHRYINESKFTLLYSGNIGEKQNWKLLLSFCNILQDKNIEIVIVGDGSYLKTLKEKTFPFNFVKFYPLVPLEELSLLLKSVDVHFLFQKTNVVDTVMPSKLLGMLGSGIPCIVTGSSDSEVAKIFNQNEIGFFFDNDNPINIITAIDQMKNNENLKNKIGKNASQYVKEYFIEEKILGNFEKRLRNEIS